MTGMKITAVGADQLARTLVAAADEVVDLAGVHREEGSATLAAAVIPRHTGRLDDSAAVVADAGGFTLTADTPYAGYVHAEDPFFTRAINTRETAIVQGVEDHITDALNTVRGA